MSFAMPELTVEGEDFDCVIVAAHHHNRYIVGVPGNRFQKKDNRDNLRMGLQGKTMAQAMIRQWLAVFDVPAVICSDRGTPFVGA